MDLSLSIRRTPDHFAAVEAHFKQGLKAARNGGISFVAGLAVPIVGGLAGAGAALILRGVPQEMWTAMAWSGLWGACVAILLMLLVRPSSTAEETERILAKRAFLSGRQVFLGDKGVIEAGEGWQLLTYWSALSAIVTMNEGYLLERKDGNGIFVPYTAFTDDSMKGAFLIYIDRRLGKRHAAKPAAPSLPPPPPDGGPIHL